MAKVVAARPGKSMAHAKTEKLPAKAVRSGSSMWLVGLLCGTMVALATPYALVVGAFLAPAIVVLATDARPGKPIGWSITMIGGAMLVRPILALWMAGHLMGAAIEIVTDARALAGSWALQGAGWLAIELGPALIRLALDGAARARAVSLRLARTKLEAEWGLPPAADGGVHTPPPPG